MQAAALGISILALVISIGFAVRSEIREGRREKRESTEFEERNRAQPIVLPRGVSGGANAEVIKHEFEVRNGGHSTMTDFTLWLQDEYERTVSSVAGGSGFVMGPDDSPAFVGVEMRVKPVPERLTVMVAWTDAAGRHGPESTGVHPQRHA